MSDLIVLHGCATIQLTKGMNTLVDERDWALLSQHKWLVAFCDGMPYARRCDYTDPAGRRWDAVHRLVYKASAGEIPPRGHIDHKNRDTLDNRRDNIRLAQKGQNNCNARKKGWRGETSSKFKGVSLRKKTGMWRVVITKDQKQYELGQFASEIDAARAYNEAAVRLFGEFARVNEI